MRKDIVETRRRPTRRREIGSLKLHIRHPSVARQAAGLGDMLDAHVDAEKLAAGMCRREDCCRNAGATTEIAPGESAFSIGWRNPGQQRDMVEPGGREEWLKAADIRDIENPVGGIAARRIARGSAIAVAGIRSSAHLFACNFRNVVGQVVDGKVSPR